MMCSTRPHTIALAFCCSVGALSAVRPLSAPVSLVVPASPVPVRAAGRVTLVYELHVADSGSSALRLERLEVRDADRPNAGPVVTYGRSELERNTKLIAPRGAPPPKALTPGVRAVIYIWIALDSAAAVPRALTHHVTFADGSSADGAQVTVGASTDLVLASPVGAGDWWIGLGPSNTSEHRRAVIRVGEDTVPHLAQRFAIDWVKMDSSGEYARDHRGRRNADWYGYEQPVFAVANARVAAVSDGIPENTPGENSRAVPMRVATVLGNYVVLDLGARAGGGPHRFALYGHLQPGSLKVQAGDSVHQGQVLGVIGNSGNSDGPHLHFHVTEATDSAAAPLRSEGVPFVLESFTVVAHDPERVAQHARLTALGLYREALPVEGDVVRNVGGSREGRAVQGGPDTVVIRNGSVTLKALLWRPNGGGPFPAILLNHGSGRTREDLERLGPYEGQADTLGPVFARHGYVFLFLFRRGVGLSAAQDTNAVDLMNGELAVHGEEARNTLQLQLLEGRELSDALAGLAFLRKLPDVDPRDVGVVGHSFGGSLTVLMAERVPDLRAVVIFSAAGYSWDRSPELRERLLAALARVQAPMFFIHAANDYTIASGKALDARLQQLGKAHRVKIYPPIGRTPDDGHAFPIIGVSRWEPDVFAFLDEHMRR